MKFRAHDTFFIRKGWLNKGMKCVKAKSDVFVSKEENPMDVLGLGSNMVKALRYWLQAVGLTSEPRSGKRTQSFTDLGNSVYENDRYIEESGTLLLLQYKLATNRDDATAWYFFFNEFNMSEFSKEDFVEALQKYIKMSDDGGDMAIRSLNDDFSCIINIDCPFGELGLVDILSKTKKIYRKATPQISMISPWVAFAIIMDQANGRSEIGLNELLTAPCNIGKIFNLDSVAMLNVLYEIEKLGTIKISRTAGLDVVNILQTYSFQECVDKYYLTIE